MTTHHIITEVYKHRSILIGYMLKWINNNVYLRICLLIVQIRTINSFPSNLQDICDI